MDITLEEFRVDGDIMVFSNGEVIWFQLSQTVYDIQSCLNHSTDKPIFQECLSKTIDFLNQNQKQTFMFFDYQNIQFPLLIGNLTDQLVIQNIEVNISNKLFLMIIITNDIFIIQLKQNYLEIQNIEYLINNIIYYSFDL